MRISNLNKCFTSGFVFRRKTRAVCSVSLTIDRGQTLAIVGESGSGKTTLARLAAGLISRDKGAILFHDHDIKLWPRKELRQKLQMVFQDADGSLNPSLTVQDLLKEPLRIHGLGRSASLQPVEKLLHMVNLTPDLLKRHPFELSGGQRQRIGLARALALEPDLIIADEPVASLDRSVQAHILELFQKFQKKLGVSYLYISHDLDTVRAIAHHAAVMLQGMFVETGPVNKILTCPEHPYTRTLLNASQLKDTPGIHDQDLSRLRISGCPFAANCRFSKKMCFEKIPDLRPTHDNNGHLVRCFFPNGKMH